MKETVSAWSKQKLVILVAGAVAIAITLVFISMSLYISGGAIQLDLSRPGYEPVDISTIQYDNNEVFSSSGPIDDAALEAFLESYELRIKDATTVDAFNASAINDKNLGIE